MIRFFSSFSELIKFLKIRLLINFLSTQKTHQKPCCDQMFLTSVKTEKLKSFKLPKFCHVLDTHSFSFTHRQSILRCSLCRFLSRKNHKEIFSCSQIRCISTVAQQCWTDDVTHNEIKMFYVRNSLLWEIHESVCEMGGCSFIFAVSIISNRKYSEDIGREKVWWCAERSEEEKKKIQKTKLVKFLRIK